MYVCKTKLYVGICVHKEEKNKLEKKTTPMNSSFYGVKTLLGNKGLKKNA
jgi:hypothetical protein